MADFLIILKHFEHLVSNIIIIYLMILVIYKVVSSLKIKQLKTIKLSHVYIHLLVLVYVVQKCLLVMAAISSLLELVTSYSFKSI
jgi:hypothetical protein